ncbi:hypothetical protein JHJ32_06480 [Parapedobacter sp. ISTM3]|uniref:hypothetical protein n=1 Tax=Parapedobacter sp. ISTM3 TaxID=2800130 RepID=UPI001903E7B0|nr:hypothetical protein [Parapedobacter sp. ISTM3]MBK1439624.1 hypothetical protein [Parapedobacter sp. ISTM3]
MITDANFNFSIGAVYLLGFTPKATENPTHGILKVLHGIALQIRKGNFPKISRAPVARTLKA